MSRNIWILLDKYKKMWACTHGLSGYQIDSAKGFSVVGPVIKDTFFAIISYRGYHFMARKKRSLFVF
jgi:hypothetical protein